MSTHTAHSSHNEVRTYTIVLAILLVLTGITVGASYIDFGAGNIVIALAIATVKASLVGLFFMHLLHDKPLNAVILVSGFLFLGLFLTLSLTDVMSRGDLQPTNLHPAPAAAPAAAAPAGQKAEEKK